MNLNLLNQREPDLKSAVLARTVTRWLVMLIGLAMFGGAAAAIRGGEARFNEYELKAGYLVNFTKFIAWPKNSFRASDAPFVIGVAGSSPCTSILLEITKGLKISGRNIVIKVLETPAAVQGTQVLFLPAAQDSRLKDWLAAAHRGGVLTVGESESFFKQGGILNYFREEEKIRFDLNIDQAESTGLQVSAQLQKLARTLRKKS